MIINAMRGSWLVLLAADGSLTTLGDFFIERDGIYYSNKTFQEKLCLSDIYQNGVHTDGLSLLCEPGPERFLRASRSSGRRIPHIRSGAAARMRAGCLTGRAASIAGMTRWTARFQRRNAPSARSEPPLLPTPPISPS